MNIRDIAKAANVSAATVSKVLNSKDGDISEATRTRVLQIIREYQYTPYANQPDSMNIKTSTVALLIHYPQFTTIEFVSELEKRAGKFGYNLLICSSINDLSDMERNLKILKKKNIDGIIICADDPAYISLALEIVVETPYCVLSNRRDVAANLVLYSHKESAYAAAQALLLAGHRRIGCVLDKSGSEYYRSQIEDGVKSVFSGYAVPWNSEHVLYLDASYDHSSMLQDFIDRSSITALFCQTVPLAVACYETALQKGYYIPQTLSIVANEINDALTAYSRQFSGTVIPYAEIAEKLFECLMRQINKSSRPNRSQSFHADYVSGRSLAAPVDSVSTMLVVGNCVTDIVIRTGKLPRTNERSPSNSIKYIPGGKCVDQSIGASKLGATAYALGRVGNDTEGHAIREILSDYSVHVNAMLVDDTISTGKTFLTIAANGDMTTITYSGANQYFSADQIRLTKELFQEVKYCLITTEIAPATIQYVLELCRENKVATFLKPSDPTTFNLNLLEYVDYFIPNESEAMRLLPDSTSIESAAQRFLDLGCRNVIITLGEKGCYSQNAASGLRVPSAPFNAVDTIGASCCFISALVKAISVGESLEYALCYATYAAGLSTTQYGIHTSFPSYQQLRLYNDEISYMYAHLRD